MNSTKKKTNVYYVHAIYEYYSYESCLFFSVAHKWLYYWMNFYKSHDISLLTSRSRNYFTFSRNQDKIKKGGERIWVAWATNCTKPV